MEHSADLDGGRKMPGQVRERLSAEVDRWEAATPLAHLAASHANFRSLCATSP